MFVVKVENVKILHFCVIIGLCKSALSNIKKKYLTY
jgi:hypothetical protein